MKNLFRGYYKFKKEEISKLWKDGIFVLDTNTLLHLFRYSKKTSADFMKILESIADRIWIPYQVALEYHQQKFEMIRVTEKHFEGLLEHVRKFQEQIKNDIKTKIKDPHKNFDELFDKVDKASSSITNEISSFKKYYPTEDESEKRSEEIAILFENKVGLPNKNEADRIKEAEARINNKIPPGYKDSSKDNYRKVGDALLWFQILDKAKAESKPIIFITDDMKEDWWYIKEGKPIGPRPELAREISEFAGVDLLMYQPSQFLKYAQTEFKQKVEKSSIDEAKQVEQNTEKERKVQNATAHVLAQALKASQGTSPEYIINQNYDRNAQATLLNSLAFPEESPTERFFRLAAAIGERNAATQFPQHVYNFDPTTNLGSSFTLPVIEEPSHLTIWDHDTNRKNRLGPTAGDSKTP